MKAFLIYIGHAQDSTKIATHYLSIFTHSFSHVVSIYLWFIITWMSILSGPNSCTIYGSFWKSKKKRMNILKKNHNAILWQSGNDRVIVITNLLLVKCKKEFVSKD